MKSTFIIEDYKALGSTWYIECFESLSAEKKQKINDKITREIEIFEKKYSRFDQDSLLNSLNKNKKIIFDKCLYDMLEQSEKWRIMTNGIFDVGIKAKLEGIGYGTPQNTDKEISWEADSTQTVRVLSKDGFMFWDSMREIDLGGIGKGYLIDKLAGILISECGLKYFLINGGGDIFVTSDNGQPVELLLEHPTEVNKYIGKVYLQNESLCASSSFKRSWIQGDIKRNHFIDTKEGRFINSASFVISDRATQADVLATVLVLFADQENNAINMASRTQADYLIINQEGEILATERFKQALKAL